jgi:hypothetical protein
MREALGADEPDHNTEDEKPASRVDKLAQRLLEDRRIKPQAATRIAGCFACNRSHTVPHLVEGGCTRFCSVKCREAFDNGFTPATDPDPCTVERWKIIAPSLRFGELRAGPPGKPLPFMPKRMTRTANGFRIACRSCGKTFESLGLAFCDPDCERKQRERNTLAATMAEAGMEPIRQKRPCQHPGCPNSIPLWRNKRKVSTRARFCDLHSRLSQASKPPQAHDKPGAPFGVELVQETPAAQGARLPFELAPEGARSKRIEGEGSGTAPDPGAFLPALAPASHGTGVTGSAG